MGRTSGAAPVTLTAHKNCFSDSRNSASSFHPLDKVETNIANERGIFLPTGGGGRMQGLCEKRERHLTAFPCNALETDATFAQLQRRDAENDVPLLNEAQVFSRWVAQSCCSTTGVRNLEILTGVSRAALAPFPSASLPATVRPHSHSICPPSPSLQGEASPGRR